MAWSYIQGISATAVMSGDFLTASISLPAPTTPGTLIVFFAHAVTDTAMVDSAYDDTGNQLTIYPETASYNSSKLWLLYGAPATASATTHSIISTVATTWRLSVGEFASDVGINSMSILDSAEISKLNNISTLTSSAAGHLILNACGWGSPRTPTAAPSYTLFVSGSLYTHAAYKLYGDVFENPYMTSSQGLRSTINASFKESSIYTPSVKYIIWQFDD